MSKSREELINNYKASAYEFSIFILKCEADIAENITETEEYKTYFLSITELAKNGIKVEDLKRI